MWAVGRREEGDPWRWRRDLNTTEEEELRGEVGEERKRGRNMAWRLLLMPPWGGWITRALRWIS